MCNNKGTEIFKIRSEYLINIKFGELKQTTKYKKIQKERTEKNYEKNYEKKH